MPVYEVRDGDAAIIGLDVDNSPEPGVNSTAAKMGLGILEDKVMDHVPGASSSLPWDDLRRPLYIGRWH